MHKKLYVVIWNPTAGSAERSAALYRELQSRDDVVLRESHSGNHARKLAASAAAENVRAVIAAGGDGTINAVARGLNDCGSDVPLGLLPLGTGNDLCRTLAVPLDPHEAANLLLAGDCKPKEIDLIAAETRHGESVFINVCNGGNSQRVADCLSKDAKRTWGAWSYLRGAVEVLTDLHGFHATVQLDDRPPESLDLWNAVVANGRTVAGGVCIVPHAELSDGLLDVMLIRDGTSTDVAALSAKFIWGNLLEDERVMFYRARRVRFDSEPPMPFVADGEPLGATPITFTVRPRSFKVLAPVMTKPS